MISHRILFLSPNYISIQQPIIDEMMRQGHEVVWVEDKDIPYNFRIPRTTLNKYRCKVMAAIRNPHRKYWNQIWRSRPQDFEKPFDLFFCINGRTLCPELFTWLNAMPNLKKCFYAWDSETIFDFFYYQQEFDKVFTFDRVDANKYPKVEHLPLFWIDNHSDSSKMTIKYDISIIGTDHDNRYKIVENILTQVKAAGLSYFFKIQVYKPDLSYIAFYKLRLLFSKSLRAIVKANELEYERKLNSEISMTGIVSPKEYSDIMDESGCILDTDRGSQCGITARAIWALAKGKKMITTNPHFKEEPFYNPNQISIIDRENPVLDIDFIRSKDSFSVSSYFDGLRIDNWVKNFIK